MKDLPQVDNFLREKYALHNALCEVESLITSLDVAKEIVVTDELLNDSEFEELTKNLCDAVNTLETKVLPEFRIDGLLF